MATVYYNATSNITIIFFDVIQIRKQPVNACPAANHWRLESGSSNSTIDMANFSELKACVTDVVTCPVCLGLFNNPKSLPCLHTYCLGCLEAIFKDNQPGTKGLCPSCRQEFDLPTNGLGGLPHNFLVQSLVDARKKPAEEKCEACIKLDGLDPGLVPPLSLYCIQCNRIVCEQCCSPHKMLNGMSHKLVPIDSLKDGGIDRKPCEKHPDELLKLHCFVCKSNICMKCSVTEHDKHEQMEIGKLSEDIIRRVDANMGHISSSITRLQKGASQIERVTTQFLGEIEEIKESIKKKGDEIKQIVDRHVTEILSELESVKLETCAEIERRKEQLHTLLMRMESFHAYCLQVKTNYTPCEMTEAGDNLEVTAKELLQTNMTAGKFLAPPVTLIGSDVDKFIKEGQNFIGTIETREYKVIAKLPEEEPVCGITTLDNELYVLRVNATNHKTQVQVFDTTKHNLLRMIKMSSLNFLADMTSCKQNQCLYISDGILRVHRLQVENRCITKWPVSDIPRGISVTPAGRLLVTCRAGRKLKEFTTDGRQLREIILPADVAHPLHAVQLPCGQFVVSAAGLGGSDSDADHLVCLVSSEGRIIKSHGGPRGSAHDQMDGPCHIAVDANKFIFISDRNNRRLKVFRPDLVPWFSRGFAEVNYLACRLHFDNRNCLYVASNHTKDGDFLSGCVIVIDRA